MKQLLAAALIAMTASGAMAHGFHNNHYPVGDAQAVFHRSKISYDAWKFKNFKPKNVAFHMVGDADSHATVGFRGQTKIAVHRTDAKAFEDFIEEVGAAVYQRGYEDGIHGQSMDKVSFIRTKKGWNGYANVVHPVGAKVGNRSIVWARSGDTKINFDKYSVTGGVSGITRVLDHFFKDAYEAGYGEGQEAAVHN